MKEQQIESIENQIKTKRHIIISKDDANKLLQALTSVKSEQVANNSEAMKWISVEDRLPEYGTQILVYGIDKAMYGVKKFHVCEMDDLEDGMEFQESRSFYWLTEKGTKIDNVTHWTPLPTTPNQ